MQEFEKWRHNSIARPITQEAFIAFEIGWRAALEEVLRVIVEDSNGPNTPKDLMKWLHEELEKE